MPTISFPPATSSKVDPASPKSIREVLAFLDDVAARGPDAVEPLSGERAAEIAARIRRAAKVADSFVRSGHRMTESLTRTLDAASGVRFPSRSP